MKVAVIGCGNMATQVVIQMYQADKNIKFITYTPTKVKALSLAEKVRGVCVNSINDINIDQIDYWLIGCKPQQVKDLANEVNGKLKNQIIISMLAATSISQLSEIFKTENILRIMPNTPIGLGQGITLINGSNNIVQSKKEAFIKTLKQGSYIIETKSEKELDELTVFSGSGPAYVFNFALSLEKKLENLGYNPTMSRELINNLFVGSSLLMKDSHLNLSDLVDQVTSKGGVTVEAINIYRSKNLEAISSLAIDKALNRSNEINQEIN